MENPGHFQKFVILKITEIINIFLIAEGSPVRLLALLAPPSCLWGPDIQPMMQGNVQPL